MTDATTRREALFDRLSEVNAGMLGLTSDLKLVPMSHQISDERDRLYFITAEGTDLQQAASAAPVEAIYALAEGGKGLYARLHGTLSQITDPARLDEIWTVVADARFEDGQRDKDVRLLELKLSSAEAWITPTSGLRFLYEVAKAKITGDDPDMGEHFEVSF